MTPRRNVIPIRYASKRARTEAGWREFYLARDRFLHAMLRRTGSGFPFATYRPASREHVKLNLTTQDLNHHTLLLGATGTGKSTMLRSLAQFHLLAERGFALIDLHGDLFTAVRDFSEGTVATLDFSKPDSLPSWNPLRPMEGIDTGRQVELLIGILKRLWASEKAESWAWGVKVQEITGYALRACIESRVPMSLIDLKSFLLLPTIRAQVLETASEETRQYFLRLFGARERAYISAVANKLDPFLSSVAVQRFLGHPTGTMDLPAMVDKAETLLVNLPKGYLGPTADVVGRLLVNVLQLAALRRERIPYTQRRPYSILLDESHNLAHRESGLEDLLVAARKYRVHVALAAQSLSLFPPGFRPHLLGNTGRQFFFRMPYAEAKQLAPDLFEPLGDYARDAVRPYDDLSDPLLTPREEIEARTRDLANLPIGQCYWLLKGRRFKGRRITLLRR